MIKQIYKLLPELNGVSAFTLIPKTVYSRDILALMVTTKHENSFGILNFVREKKTERLDALLSPIHIVSQE